MNHTLKIIGTAELPNALEMGQDYIVAGKLSIPKIEKIDNEDGTFTFCHKAKLIQIELADKAGKTYKGVAKGSKSQKLRWRILETTDNDGYEAVMTKLIDNWEDINEFLNQER